MLRYLYKYMCVSLAALLAAACADLPETTEVPDAQEPRYMTFDISEIDTKVSDSDLTSYEFSIWIYEPNKDSDQLLVDGDNVKLRYDSVSRRWRFHDGSSFKDVEWGNGNHDFFVVSSYDLAGTSEKIHFDKSRLGYTSLFQLTSARFVVPAMNMTYSSDGSDYNYYKDILYAAASRDVSKDGYKPVSLTLGHLWPALEFNMINETDQNKYITGFSVSNFRVNSNTTIEFSASSGYNTTLPSNNSDDFATNKYEVADFVLVPGEQRSVFGMPVMVFPQEFVSDENSAKLSFSVDGVKTTKSFFVVGSDGLSTQEWNPGRLYSYDIRLTTPADSVVIKPKKPSITHFKDASGVLTHSVLSLDLNNLEDAQLRRVKNLRVVVSKGGVDYLDQTFATVSSNQMTLYKGSPSDLGRFYMPQGAGYQVTLTYNDGFYDHTVTCEAIESPTPAYTLNLNFTATPTDVTIHSATVSISENVLAEVPLAPDNSYDIWIRFAGDTQAIFGLSHLDPSKSVFISEKTLASAPYSNGGKYNLGCFIRFDGVQGSVTYTTSNTMDGTSVTPVKYKRGNRLSSATELKDGKMYILEASKHTGNYWSVGADESLEFSSQPSSFDDIPKKYVFKYMEGNTVVNMEPGYCKYSSVGAWYSVSTGKYMNEGDDPSYFNSSSPVRYVKCGTGWGSNDGNEFDISKGYSGGVPELLRYSSSTSRGVYWGDNGAPNYPIQYWKWYIYEVVYE